jgi:hypothetical protein
MDWIKSLKVGFRVWVIGLRVFKIRGVGYWVKGCQKKEELGYLLA